MLSSGASRAQDTTSVAQLLDFSLEELMNFKVTVASKKNSSIRETPGIITVITKEDIAKTGSRDLMDVLTLLVPGFNFGADVEGYVGLTVRGFWGANEGKVLTLLDGQVFNEEMFATVPFGNHIPLENIERIEIIRGPGSAIYGGYAGLAVINIITKGAEIKGGYASALYSQMKHTYSHRNVAFGYGNQFKDLSFSLTGEAGQGMRSDRPNIDYYGDTLNMNGSSELNSTNLNLNLKYKNISFRGMADLYRTTQIDLWGYNYKMGPLAENFDSYFGDLSYMLNIGSKLKIAPSLQFKRQYPWQLSVTDQGYVNQKHIDKTTFNTIATWDISDKMNLVSGIEYYRTRLQMPSNADELEEDFKNGEDHLDNSNFSVFTQWMLLSKVLNLTVGGRYDHNEAFGSNFAPRIGLTKAFSRFHFKAMISQSFRVPGGIIPNRIPAGVPSVKPEIGTNFELELGYKVGEKSWFVVNGYDVSFNRLIAYHADSDTGIGSYQNFGEMGSRGIEAEHKFKSSGLEITTNYAFYAISKNSVEAYKIPGNEAMVLGLPQHRINMLAGIRLDENISINPSFSIFGVRYAYTGFDANGNDILTKYNPSAYLNCTLAFKNVMIKNLEVNAGVKNITNEAVDYLQPYKGAHAPLPGPSRSLVLRIFYKFESN